MRIAIVALLLCACSQQPENRFPEPVGVEAPAAPVVPPPTDAEAAEMERIERECTAALTMNSNQLSCDFSTLAEARLWQAQHQRRQPR